MQLRVVCLVSMGFVLLTVLARLLASVVKGFQRHSSFRGCYLRIILILGERVKGFTGSSDMVGSLGSLSRFFDGFLDSVTGSEYAIRRS